MATQKLRRPNTVLETAAERLEGLPERDAQGRTWRNENFVFVHYPDGWTFERGEFMPTLAAIKAKGGVNGVGDDGSLAKPKAGSSEKGGVVIMPNDRRLGNSHDEDPPGWRNYVAAYDVIGVDGRGNHVRTGSHYCFFACTFDVQSNGSVHPNPAPEKWYEFRRYIRDRGIIDPIDQAAYSKIHRAAENQVSRAARAAGVNPALTGKMERAEANLKAIEEAWKKHLAAQDAEAEAPPEIPTKRSKLRPSSAAAPIPAGV